MSTKAQLPESVDAWIEQWRRCATANEEARALLRRCVAVLEELGMGRPLRADIEAFLAGKEQADAE